MPPGRISKQPNEKFDLDFDFSRDIPTGDTLQAGTGTSTVTVSPAGLTLSSAPAKSHDTASEKVKQWIEGGTAGVQYKVTCLMTTTAGRIFELDFIVDVVDE